MEGAEWTRDVLRGREAEGSRQENWGCEGKVYMAAGLGVGVGNTADGPLTD